MVVAELTIFMWVMIIRLIMCLISGIEGIGLLFEILGDLISLGTGSLFVSMMLTTI